MSDTPLFDRVAVLGLGLIGSSLCRVMKRDSLASHVAGHARSAETREASMKLGFLDSVYEKAADAVKDADLVIFCVPVAANAAVAEAIADALRPGAIVTDVGSVKVSVIRDIGPCLPDGAHLVPGHPVAGTEHSGPESGFPDLFRNRYCILTPPPGTDTQAVDRVAELWRRAGSIVELMAPHHHDRVLAVTSHLPHLIA